MSWIKMRCELATDPAVAEIAARAGLDRFAVVGRLHTLWSWADCQSVDGNALRVTRAFLDELVSHAGFADAMTQAGWLSGNDFALSFPAFHKHNGETAKSRSLTARRVAKHRGNETPPERHRNAESVTDVTQPALAREEKIREEKNLPEDKPAQARLFDAEFPAELDTPEFRAAWDRYTEHRRATRCSKLKPHSVALKFAEMAEWGAEAAVAQIDVTIANGWQGIFKPKPENRNGNHRRPLAESPRNLGTANEGRSGQYAGVGKVRAVPDPPRPAA